MPCWRTCTTNSCKKVRSITRSGRSWYASGEDHRVGQSLGGRPSACSGRFSSDVLPAPIPGQQLVDALDRVVGQACEHVGEPGLRIDVVELGGGDQRVDGSRTTAALVG